jgi:hypothetical protein
MTWNQQTGGTNVEGILTPNRGTMNSANATTRLNSQVQQGVPALPVKPTFAGVDAAAIAFARWWWMSFPGQLLDAGREPLPDPGRAVNSRMACGLPVMKMLTAESAAVTILHSGGTLLKLWSRKGFMSDLKSGWERNQNPMNFRDVDVKELENPEVQTHDSFWDEPCPSCGIPLWACQRCE